MRDKFTYGGGTHVALRYARMNRTRPISVEQTMALFPHKFSKPSRVKESFNTLTRHGLLTETKKGWVITTRGIDHLTNISKLYLGEFK
jgi:ribosomal protein S19E (S16A)